MSDQRLKIAVFIDFDNIEIGVKTTLGRQFDIGAVLEAVKERGEIITKVAYGDWKRAGDYGRAMSNHAVRLVQRVMTPGGDKNGADINLALDALEMAFTHAHINAFVIVGGDSDFITLVEKLKQYDQKVFVVGGRAFTSQVMQKNCTEFIAYENVVPCRIAAAPPRADNRRRAAPRSRRRRAADRGACRSSSAPSRCSPIAKCRRSSACSRARCCSSIRRSPSATTAPAPSASSPTSWRAGLVTLKHQGRSTLVELADDEHDRSDAGEPAAPAPRPAPVPAVSMRPDLPNDGDRRKPRPR